MIITTERLKQIIKEEVSQYIVEGGNIFKGETQSIPRESIRPTLERYYKILKDLFPQKAEVFDKFEPVGSVGKKPVSGDIDIALDAREMFDGGEINSEELIKWNVDPQRWEEEFQKIHKRARTASEKMSRWKAFLRLVGEYTEQNAEMIKVAPAKVTYNNLFSLFPQFDVDGIEQPFGVQIDWMIGGIEWLKFAYHSDPPVDGENIKGLHRTQLMLAMFGQKGYSFQHGRGVINKETKEIVVDTPEEALNLLGNLYHTPITREQTNNYHNLHQYLLQNATEKEYNDVIDSYLKILDYTRADIPLDIQDKWIENKERLKLTGRYLPDDSNLKRYAI